MKRRSVLAAASGIAGTAFTGGLLWAPGAYAKDHRNSHDAYFAHLNQLLKHAGPGRPVMLVDLERVDANIDRIVESVGKSKRYRVVVKSLPSVALLKHVMERAATDALMVFHQPFLNAVAIAFPGADVLLGKPMPVAAVKTFYRELGKTKFEPARQVQWLVDSNARLLQYQSFARQMGLKLLVNFEIDVGLHRGGFASPEAIDSALATVAADPEHLRVSGLMGYEAHLTGRQADLRHPDVLRVLGIYRGFIQRLQQAGIDTKNLTLNGAGSHTLKIYEKDDTMNDLAAGSGVVMPTDFDTFHLAEHQPAIFIATPILKRYDGNPFLADPPADMQRLYYIYGGYWKAKMVSPARVGPPIYESTNQSPIVTAGDVDLQVDDYMFLRPTQSESVMLQFGDLLAVSQGQIAARWPVFR